MPITTYGELKSAVVDWAERSDIPTARIETFIYLAEADASQVLRVPAMEHPVLLPVTDGRVTIPFDFLQLRSLTWEGRRDVVLQYLPWDQFVATNRDPGALDPTYFSRQGPLWYITGEPEDGTEVLCHYYRFIPALQDTVNETNWLLDISPQAYLFGALKYLYEFTMDNERSAYWEDKFNKELVKLQALADSAEHRGSVLSVSKIQ